MKYIKLLWELHRLKYNTKKTKEQIQALQKEKLSRILHFAYDHSPYYRVRFTQAGITKQTIDTTPMSKFPIMNKSILMEHFDELVTVPDVKQSELQSFDENKDKQTVFKHEYHVVHSSGSTGKPGYFIYDKDAWNKMILAIIRGALWDMSMMDILRLLWKTPRIVYIAATDGRYGGAMAVGSGIEGVHAKQLSLDIKQPLQEWIDKILEFKPNIIIGYPSAIKILADLVEKNLVKVKVERIISCGEPLNGNLRLHLEHIFQCNVVNFYGASETLALGVELHVKEGMYLFDDMNYVEVENGRMYVTSLYNFAQPLIRYELSDQLVWEQYDQRYPFSKIKNLMGRNEDLMWFKNQEGNKEFLHPLAIEGFCMEGMLDYQFVQKDDTSFELKIETDLLANKDKICMDMTDAIQKILFEKKLEYIHFIIIFVDEILPDRTTGKKPLIVKQRGERR